jgi:hypothetical protein
LASTNIKNRLLAVVIEPIPSVIEAVPEDDEKICGIRSLRFTAGLNTQDGWWSRLLQE